MEGVVFRRDLLAPGQLKALSRRSDARGLLQLGSHVAALAATGTGLALTWGGWWAVPLFVAHGILLNYTYAAQHECSHWTAFRTRWLNDAVGRVCGFLQLYPRDYDRWFHFAHHRHTQDPARDPEIKGGSGFTRAGFLWDLTGIDYWIRRVRCLARVARGDTGFEDYLTEPQRRTVVRETRAHLAAYAALALLSVVLQSWALVIFWLGPLLATKWAHEPQNLIEHSGLTRAPDTLANTRTIRTNPLQRWLLWNMAYHTVHHTFPGVPFHRLPALHRAVTAKLGHELPTSGYAGFIAGMLRDLPRSRGALQPAE